MPDTRTVEQLRDRAAREIQDWVKDPDEITLNGLSYAEFVIEAIGDYVAARVMEELEAESDPFGILASLPLRRKVGGRSKDD